ncbi:MAG: site-2 protease family protein [Bacteroidetes bacterium]|nr:site-2 protease family protein [Bacteroidota bacterium]
MLVVLTTVLQMLEWILIALALLALFWLFLVLANRRYHLEKRGFTITPGVLMWRTKRGLRFIDRVGGTCRRGWLAFGTVAAVIGVALMIFMLFGLCLNAFLVLSRPEVSLPGVRFALPGLIPGLTIHWWLIAIASLLLVHEFAHGFVTRAQGIPIKSMGGLFLVVIPGAFVEPDEKKLKGAPVFKRLRIFGVGSFANVLFAFLCLGIILLLLTPKPGVYVWGVRENGPSENFLTPGMHILGLDNVPLESWGDYYDFIENVNPGENVSILTENGILTVVTDNYRSENEGDLGIWPASAIPRSNFINPLTGMGVMVLELTGQPVFHPYLYDSLAPWWLIDALKWIFVLNLGIGLFQLLPIMPLDGGYLFQGVVEAASSKRTSRRVARALSFIVLALLLVNFVPLFT